jgi:hypothetical protein
MAEVLVPISNHLFSSSDLDAQVSRIPLEPGFTGGAMAAVDNEGVRVALLYTRKDGHIRIKGAYEHDWRGDDKIAGEILFRW